MMRSFGLALVLVAAWSALQTAPYGWEFEELAPGVRVALQAPENRFDESNSVVIVGPHGVLVVDAQASAQAVAGLQEAIAGWTDLPVRTLVVTHWHGDHTMGAARYRDRYGPDLTIIGHVTLLEDVPGRAAAQIDEQRAYLEAEIEPARQRVTDGVDREGRVMDRATREDATAQIEAAEEWLQRHRDARFELPDLAYRSALLTARAGRPVEFIHAPGHTRGDTVVWLPEDRILIAGDLVDAMPFAGHGAPATWARTLRTLLQLDFERVVPGHGPIYDRTRVELLAEYFEDLSSRAAEVVAAGGDLEAALTEIDMTPWRARLAESEQAGEFFDQVVGEAIRAAWEEAARDARQ